jgi:hypothetical protein
MVLATTAWVVLLLVVVVTFFESSPFLTVRLLLSKVAVSMTPETETFWPRTRAVPVPAERFAPAIATLPVAVPSAPTAPMLRSLPALIFARRLVELVSVVVLLLRFDLKLSLAVAVSRAEVMETPFVPVRVALPPAVMSEPLTARVSVAAMVRLPPAVMVDATTVSLLVLVLVAL